MRKFVEPWNPLTCDKLRVIGCPYIHQGLDCRGPWLGLKSSREGQHFLCLPPHEPDTRGIISFVEHAPKIPRRRSGCYTRLFPECSTPCNHGQPSLGDLRETLSTRNSIISRSFLSFIPHYVFYSIGLDSVGHTPYLVVVFKILVMVSRPSDCTYLGSIVFT